MPQMGFKAQPGSNKPSPAKGNKAGPKDGDLYNLQHLN